MGKNRIWILIAGVMMTTGVYAQAHGGGGCGEDGGGQVPIPFSVNRKVELADGENYTLVGRLVYGPSIFGGNEKIPYLAVDLTVHPWLASSKRAEFPYYPIMSYGNLFAAERATDATIDGGLIKVSVRAHGKVVAGVGEESKYIVYLEPMSNAVLFEKPRGKAKK